MKLSNKTLIKLFNGAIDFDEDEGYLYADRGSCNQHDYLNANFKGSNFSEILQEGSSIHIKFKTNANKVAFNYKVALCLNPKCSLDVFVNGEPYLFVDMGNLKENGKFAFPMANGEKLVEIYLPLDARIGFKNFEICGNWRSTSKPKTKVLWYGDSITEGYGAYYSSLIYASQVNRALNYNAVNQGVGGYYFDAKFIQRLPHFIPDKIIIALGTNQINREDNFKRIDEFYDRLPLVFPGRKILTITPLWRGDIVDLSNLNKTRDYISKVASKYGDVIDGYKLIPHLSAYFMDNLHPNALGMTVIANNLVKEIKKLKF